MGFQDMLTQSREHGTLNNPILFNFGRVALRESRFQTR